VIDIAKEKKMAGQISAEHGNVRRVLTLRIREMTSLKARWMDGDVGGALLQASKAGERDPTVVCDFVRSIRLDGGANSAITLEHAVTLLPLLTRMLEQPQFVEHIQVATGAVQGLFKGFGDVIASTMRVGGAGQAVNMQLEERMNRCAACHTRSVCGCFCCCCWVFVLSWVYSYSSVQRSHLATLNYALTHSRFLYLTPYIFPLHLALFSPFLPPPPFIRIISRLPLVSVQLS
jgi:hypothetical protein